MCTMSVFYSGTLLQVSINNTKKYIDMTCQWLGISLKCTCNTEQTLQQPGLQSQCQSVLGGIRFLTTLGVSVRSICPTPEVQLNQFHIKLLSWIFLLKWYIVFWKLLLKQNSCFVPWFLLIASCYKIVDSPTSFIISWYVKESEIWKLL